jgi:hypothetical protein
MLDPFPCAHCNASLVVGDAPSSLHWLMREAFLPPVTLEELNALRATIDSSEDVTTEKHPQKPDR